MRAARADGGPVDDRAHEFVQEQLRSGEPQVPQYVAENDFPARAARGVQAVDTAASRVNNMLADIAGQPAMRSPEGRSASEIVQSAMPVDPYQAVQQAAGQWREGDKLGAAETMATAMPMQGAIRAYHGSPHKFDRFDISKIGTGEGAQAYGHGLYFAESEPVARSYRDALTRTSGAGANEWSARNRDLASEARASLNEFARNNNIPDPDDNLFALMLASAKGGNAPDAFSRDLAQRIKQSYEVPPGSMYEVDIHANPEHLLDWDRPLSEQSEHIRALVDKMKEKSFLARRALEAKDATGRTIWEKSRNPFVTGAGVGNDAAASSMLREAGIPGIKYLDAGSRGAGEGSRNYVMFSHDPIEILRRYANGGEVEGDVQFAPEDPYAKVQEAARLPMMAQNDFAMRMPQSDVRYDTGPQPGEATMKAYEPTIKERIYQTVAGTEERPSPERAQFARGISNMAEFAPVLGNVMAGQEAQRRGDTKGMLMAALPVPGMATEARMAQAAITPAEQAAKEALLALHNMKSHRLDMAEKLGGLPVPSIAIAKPEHGFTGFGDITLVGGKEFATPSRTNPVFASDVYSPRFPNLSDEGDKIFRGYTPAGYRRYAPLNMQNVVREMKGNIRGGENYNYGAGNVRASVTPQFKKLSELQRMRDKIIPTEDFEPLKEEANAKLFELAEKFHPYSRYSNSSFGHASSFAQTLSDVGKGRYSAFNQDYKDLPDELRVKAAEYLNYLRGMPTEYFEAKPQRAVELGEFAGAVVPEKVMKDVEPRLKNLGIREIVPFNPKEQDAQKKAFREFKGFNFADGGEVVNKSDPYDNIQEAAKIHPRARRASH
jgi:hypothetical protein